MFKQGSQNDRIVRYMIDYGGMTSDDPELTLPHPRARERDFVMRPWRELERRLDSSQ